LVEKRKSLNKELASLEQEFSLSTMSKDEYGEVMKEVELNGKKIDREINNIQSEIDSARKKIEEFNREEEDKKERIFALQDAMQAEQSHLNGVVEKRNEYRVSIAKLETRREDMRNEVYQEMKLSIESIIEKGFEKLNLNELDTAFSRIQKLKYKLSLIGGIDEDVVKEFVETKKRSEDLRVQLEDLQKAMDDLNDLVVELDKVMKKKRDKAFKQIKKEFSRFFALLFDGGKADIVELFDTEEESGEPAEIEDGDLENIEINKKQKKILQGIDIIACPPGKKIKNIQALSGGERTLTSIALVCAILHTNPSPFVVLDEVEAALDEANSLRFTKILRELAEDSQFVIITHNRATMHAADVLYGVTMGNDGVSKLLSVKIDVD